MQLEVGTVLEGKVTGITKFGAFVALPGGKSGLIHISEVANSFVSDVHDHVQVGQTVKVRVLNVSGDGKINLSLKRAEENPAPQPRQEMQRPALRRRAPEAIRISRIASRNSCRIPTAGSRTTASTPITGPAAAEDNTIRAYPPGRSARGIRFSYKLYIIPRVHIRSC